MKKLILKAVRDMSGKTAKEVAKEIGTSENMMVDIENGTKKCSEELKEKLCKVYLNYHAMWDNKSYRDVVGKVDFEIFHDSSLQHFY